MHSSLPSRTASLYLGDLSDARRKTEKIPRKVSNSDRTRKRGEQEPEQLFCWAITDSMTIISTNTTAVVAASKKKTYGLWHFCCTSSCSSSDSSLYHASEDVCKRSKLVGTW